MSIAIATAHRPNIRRLEIHLTYRCNLRCLHCSNLITQAPSVVTMPVDRVRQLVAESIELDWPWDWLVLHGGEPTLHPEFEKVCAVLAAYRVLDRPAVQTSVCTNGFGERVQNQLKIAERHGVRPENSRKDGKPAVGYHVPISRSPIDDGLDYALGCFQSSQCGIAYTNEGFYECSPAAAGYRLFGYEPMAIRLADVTEERLAAGYARHCGHCGYAAVQQAARLVSMATVKQPQQDPNPEAPVSKTWGVAMRMYNSEMNSKETNQDHEHQ